MKLVWLYFLTGKPEDSKRIIRQVKDSGILTGEEAADDWGIKQEPAAVRDVTDFIRAVRE